MLLATLWATVRNQHLLETLDQTATLLIKVSSTVFVLVMVGSLLLSLALGTAKNLSHMMRRVLRDDSRRHIVDRDLSRMHANANANIALDLESCQIWITLRLSRLLMGIVLTECTFYDDWICVWTLAE